MCLRQEPTLQQLLLSTKIDLSLSLCTPPSADESGGGPASQQASQNSATTATATATAATRGFKRDPSRDHHHHHLPGAAAAPPPPSLPPRPRGNYDPARGSALLGPLSVNDPQLERQDKGDRFILSESFLNIASPFGPFGASNDWRILQKDAPEHVHRLLRALVAAQDYAGAARALATLHRLHSVFDPDVYRFTVGLLRLSGNHQVRCWCLCSLVGSGVVWVCGRVNGRVL